MREVQNRGKVETKYTNLQSKHTKMGKMYVLDKNDVLDDERQSILAQNYLLFRENLMEYLTDISYYELRSIDFK